MMKIKRQNAQTMKIMVEEKEEAITKMETINVQDDDFDSSSCCCSRRSTAKTATTTTTTTTTIMQEVFTHNDLQVLNLLSHPVWIFDITSKSMYWGNKEALKLWSAKSLQDLVSRNFASDMSESTDTRLNDYLQRFDKGEKIQDQWTMYPNFGKDGPKTINCSMSGITIQQQQQNNNKTTSVSSSSSSPRSRRLAMLVEAVYVEESKDDKEKETNNSLLRGLETLRHLPVVVRQFDLDGNLMDQNPEALKLFGTGERTTTTPATTAPATTSNDDKDISSSSSSSSSSAPAPSPKADASTTTQQQQQQQQSLSEFLQCFEDLELGKSVLQEVAINGHDCTLEAKQRTIAGTDDRNDHHHGGGGGGSSSNGYSSSSSNHSNNIKWFSIKVRRVRDPVTSKPVIIYSARDVSTIMLKAQEEADKITAKKNEFFAVMAHEIRTPLHQVVGFIELLARTTPLSKEQTEFCSLLQTSTHALMAIINDLLDFTKLEAGKVILENIPFEPRAVIDGCVAAIQPQAESRHITLSSNFTTTQIDASNNNANDNIPRKLVGDPNRIRQVLLNIVQNAVKFTPAGGKVQIEASLSGPSSQVQQQSNESQISQVDGETDDDDDDECNRNSNRNNVAVLRVEVEDTGIGICNAKLERIFNPYQQADASVSRTYGGTGLGLAICQSLTENMNGKIGVESHIGVGTKFWFEIPLLNNNITYLNNNNNNQTSKHNNSIATISSVCDNQNNNTPKHSRSNCIAMKNMAKDDNNKDDDEQEPSSLRILVAEDNKVNQKVASAMLKRLGHIPTIVENGQLAVDEICSKEQNCDYDLVLMDVQMPVLDGIDATKAIRRKGYLKSDLPIVALTASIQTVDWIQCGMNDCIKKPVRLVDLKQSLAKHAVGTKT